MPETCDFDTIINYILTFGQKRPFTSVLKMVPFLAQFKIFETKKTCDARELSQLGHIRRIIGCPGLDTVFGTMISKRLCCLYNSKQLKPPMPNLHVKNLVSVISVF